MPKIGPFIAGGIVGAVAALLYAPRTGVQTRALVSEKVNAVWGEASDFAESAGVNPASVFQGVADTAQSVAQNIQDKMPTVTIETSFDDEPEEDEPVCADNDDLREKIEAARERIAAQVVKNAEESQAAAAAAATAEATEAPAQVAAEQPAAE